MSGMDNFLGSAVCLGDLLTNEGYHLAYYGGASLDFAGKGKLYKTHGFSEIKGRDELTPMLEDKDYSSGWGLYDDSLLGLVYDKFLTLSEEGRRFGLVTLTLDTHHPNGHPSKSCDGVKYQQGDNPILNAVACSDYLITKFVNKVIESKYAKDTVIILASDHLAKRNTAHDILKKNEQKRRNVFMVIDPAQVNYKEVKTEGSTLDVGVNILPFIGYRGSLGLGRKLTDNEQEVVNEKTLIHKNLTRWKRFIQGFWGLDKARNELTNYTNKSDGQEI
jgi:phosphoglycerol transferase